MSAAPAAMPARVVLMKYGYRGTEDVSVILRRKRAELEASGRVFWGYNGTLCDPVRQVRPFCEAAAGEPVHLALSPTPSPLYASGTAASECSADRKTWGPVPEGVRVLDSRKALVADSLQRVDLRLDLSTCSVAVGPSRGRSAAEHLRFRVDKACLERRDAEGARREVQVDWLLRLAPPYAVYLR